MLPGRSDGEELFARSTLVDHAHDMQCNAVELLTLFFPEECPTFVPQGQ